MIHPEKLEMNSKWSNGVEHLVPKITSSILDGVRTCKIEQSIENRIFRHRKAYHPNGISHHFKVPLKDRSNRGGSKNISPHTASDVHTVFVVHHDTVDKEAVRSFIGGLSHCYNNLLTGIWGYASLMGLILDKNHPLQSHIGQIEALIQDGSNLIHLLFGYIVERRSVAKKLRLTQLIQEIENYQHDSSNKINLPIFETGIMRLSKIRNKKQLAACISPVITQMMTLVHEERSAMDPHCHDLSKAETYLDKIDELIRRGFGMIRDLDFYAGNLSVKRKRVSLKSIILNQTSRADVKRNSVTVTQDIASDLPEINADRSTINYALKHLFDNAVDAIADNGKIHFNVNTLNSENPHERCGVHSLNNYVVITISDNGKGMTKSTQAQIFDPFFTGYRGQGKAGLGLAAAAGIVKAHGGYIQVRSENGIGSVFKIYLPLYAPI